MNGHDSKDFRDQQFDLKYIMILYHVTECWKQHELNVKTRGFELQEITVT